MFVRGHFIRLHCLKLLTFLTFINVVSSFLVSNVKADFIYLSLSIVTFIASHFEDTVLLTD